LAKALKAGVEVTDGAPYVPELWQVVEANLERKLGEKPVHTLDEIRHLHALFPDNITFLTGRLDGRTVAGVVLFSTEMVARTQYIASDAVGYDVSALDAVIEQAVDQARQGGRRYFDFGTSNRDGGRHLSASVYEFKLQFGGGGVVHEFYDLALNA
jgi:lipid II:glycine glycyltransferase (peptidoglycan interpeptide bridge formation enzyme)